MLFILVKVTAYEGPWLRFTGKLPPSCFIVAREYERTDAILTLYGKSILERNSKIGGRDQ